MIGRFRAPSVLLRLPMATGEAALPRAQKTRNRGISSSRLRGKVSARAGESALEAQRQPIRREPPGTPGHASVATSLDLDNEDRQFGAFSLFRACVTGGPRGPACENIDTRRRRTASRQNRTSSPPKRSGLTQPTRRRVSTTFLSCMASMRNAGYVFRRGASSGSPRLSTAGEAVRPDPIDLTGHLGTLQSSPRSTPSRTTSCWSGVSRYRCNGGRSGGAAAVGSSCDLTRPGLRAPSHSR